MSPATTTPPPETVVSIDALGMRVDLRARARLSPYVTLATLEGPSSTCLPLHEACVAVVHDCALAPVGLSDRGKTTASRHPGTSFADAGSDVVAVAEFGRLGRGVNAPLIAETTERLLTHGSVERA